VQRQQPFQPAPIILEGPQGRLDLRPPAHPHLISKMFQPTRHSRRETRIQSQGMWPTCDLRTLDAGFRAGIAMLFGVG